MTCGDLYLAALTFLGVGRRICQEKSQDNHVDVKKEFQRAYRKQNFTAVKGNLGSSMWKAYAFNIKNKILGYNI